jgi:hypothetical protein
MAMASGLELSHFYKSGSNRTLQSGTTEENLKQGVDLQTGLTINSLL